MSHLALRLFGVPTILLDQQPIRIRRHKALALLIYLAATQAPHSREELAALFWPEQDHKAARNNLRRALYSLHRLLGEGTPAVEGDRIALPVDEQLHVDVTDFHQTIAAGRRRFDGAAPVGPTALAELEQAVALYRDDFARGLSLDDCPEFEAWQREQSESLRADLVWALTALSDAYAAVGDGEAAIRHARRLAALNPYDEAALRRLMQCYAQAGQAASAVRAYEQHAELLAHDLDAAPAPATRRLYRQIQDGSFAPDDAPTAAPSSSPPQPHRPAANDAPFVAREYALSELARYLQATSTGQGRILFVTGDAGSGKTTLLREFARRAARAQPALTIAYGACTAHIGDGDPYLPLREALQDLLGLRRWSAATWPDRQARAPETIVRTVDALLAHGPALLNRLIDPDELRRAIVPAGYRDNGWSRRVLDDLERLGVQSPDGRRLQEETAAILQVLTQAGPLLLLLDDLHWADLPSLNLLLYLARTVGEMPLLIVGAYRPEEVAWQPGPGHALAPLVEELQRLFGPCRLSLDLAADAEGRHFIDALLDLEPNRLDEAFRQALFARSRGHALFTVELLRQMREQGDIVQAEDGRWVAGQVSWERLPSRVEAVIAHRLRRLPAEQLRMLSAASVEGETFTVEVVARALDMAISAVHPILSRTLQERHHLVRGVGAEWADGQPLSRYQFRHSLFQHYLYHSLDPTERQRWHGRIGLALAECCRADPPVLAQKAPALAHHFETAGLTEQAVTYRRLAAARAGRLSAHAEAIVHLERALVLVRTTPPGPDRARTEQAILLELSVPVAARRGYGHDALQPLYAQALNLAPHANDVTREFEAQHGDWRYVMLRGRLARGLALALRLTKLADRTGDAQLQIEAWRALGITHFHRGNLHEAHSWLTHCSEAYDPQRHADHAHIYGHDPAVSARGYLAHIDWLQARPASAQSLTEATIVHARTLAHPFTLAHALIFNGAHLFFFLQEPSRVIELAAEGADLAETYQFPMWRAAAQIFSGWAQSARGRPDEGVPCVTDGVAAWREGGSQLALAYHLAILADAQRLAGEAEQGLHALENAFAAADRTGERWWDPELHRLKGDLRCLAGAKSRAIERCYANALSAAEAMAAPALAQRATNSLAQIQA